MTKGYSNDCIYREWVLVSSWWRVLLPHVAGPSGLGSCSCLIASQISPTCFIQARCRTNEQTWIQHAASELGCKYHLWNTKQLNLTIVIHLWKNLFNFVSFQARCCTNTCPLSSKMCCKSHLWNTKSYTIIDVSTERLKWCATNVVKHITSNIACEHSERYSENSVFWLAKMMLCVMTLHYEFPAFLIDQTSFQCVNKRFVDTLIVIHLW